MDLYFFFQAQFQRSIQDFKYNQKHTCMRMKSILKHFISSNSGNFEIQFSHKDYEEFRGVPN